MCALRITAEVGERGPVIVLGGGPDMTTASELNHALAALLACGMRHLTVDIAGLALAESASIQALVLAARTLRERDGELLMLRP